jgi:SAM-dependent methyltransferase
MALKDDGRAMKEVERVLKPDGIAILQVPAYWTGPRTLEAPEIEERLKHFGDPNIYRIYTEADFVTRMNESGFEIHRFFARSFDPALQTRYSLYGEILHIGRKLPST